MSVIAEGWKGPARRLLCRTVVVKKWDRLAKGVPEWAKQGLQNVSIDSACWSGSQLQEAADALFKFLMRALNLRLLRLDSLPFHSFGADSSALLRTTHLLPFLNDLTIFSDRPFPQSVIADILATSNGQINRLHLQNGPYTIAPITSERLDFGGNLRYLRVEGLPSLETLDRSSLVGLKEVHVDGVLGQSTDQAMELFSAVAPTLEKFTIGGGNVTGIVESFPLLTRLTRLSLPSVPASPDSLLLPPSVVSSQTCRLSQTMVYVLSGDG